MPTFPKTLHHSGDDDLCEVRRGEVEKVVSVIKELTMIQLISGVYSNDSVTAVKVVQVEPPLVASPTPPLLPRTGTDLLFGRYQVILMKMMIIMI